ncbi:glycosyltransferase [Actinoplanes sp. NPDC049118]|uniref:glycosyltransferase n=1 Tax=Actinoplanes sp. NPDC049118 TaxID=3155769 RepID=UPI003404F48C
MRVLHIISTLAEGGAEHQLRLLVRRLPYDCEVVTLSRPGAVAAALRADGTTVHEVITTRDRDLSAVIKLRRLIRLGHFDVVHTHLYRACVQGLFAARLAGVRHVVATEYHLGGDGGARALYLIGERLGRLTIAASEPIAGRLRALGVPDERITVIPKAIDPAEFRYDPALRAAARARLGIGPGVRVIGGVGRLEPGKRFDRLIRAVGEVPEAILLLVGDGSARPALERLAVIEGVADRVTFAGAVGHAREMLCAMDVFASPSDEDTFGLVVLEALASGLPALYAVCPPLEELAAARSAVGGAERLSPHDPESLPRKLRTELLCFEERRGARLPARSAGERYDAAELAASVGQLYERMAGGRSPLRRGTREQSSIARPNEGKRRRRRRAT